VAADHNALVGLVAVAIVSQDMGGSHLDGVLHGGQVLVGWSNSLLDGGQVLVGQLVHITTVATDNHATVGLVTVAIIGQDGLGSLDGSQVLVGRSNGLLDGGQVLVGQLVDVTTVTAEHHTLVGLVTVAIISQDGLGGSLHGSQVLVGRSSNWGQVLVGGQLVHITTVATVDHATVGLVKEQRRTQPERRRRRCRWQLGQSRRQLGQHRTPLEQKQRRSSWTQLGRSRRQLEPRLLRCSWQLERSRRPPGRRLLHGGGAGTGSMADG